MDDIARQVWDLDFGVSKSIRYHAYARAYWDGLDHWNKVAILISGAAICVAFLNEKKALEPYVAGLVALLAIFDIVFGFSDRARLHSGLYRQFCQLAQDIAGTVSPSAVDIARWRARRLEIETEEPRISERLNRRCYREEAKARGVSKLEIKKAYE